VARVAPSVPTPRTTTTTTTTPTTIPKGSIPPSGSPSVESIPDSPLFPLPEIPSKQICSFMKKLYNVRSQAVNDMWKYLCKHETKFAKRVCNTPADKLGSLRWDDQLVNHYLTRGRLSRNRKPRG
jgi:hypothetical protein